MLLVLVAADSFLVEPHWLQVSRVTISSGKLKKPVRIVVVADLQADRIGPYERDALARAMAERPDVMLFAGDYLQERGPPLATLQTELREVFSEIKLSAPEGVFAVQGNIDADDWTPPFAGLGIELFESTRSVNRPHFRVTGLSVEDSYNTSLAVPTADRFHIALGHSPNFALGDVRADLLVTGHTHGGQVRLPLLGPVITLSRVPRSWAAGVTPLEGGRTLVVSRGIGMERGKAPRLRFLCRPELVVIDVVPGGP